jgi:hypothetical protein
MASFPPPTDMNRRSYSANALLQENANSTTRNKTNLRSTKNTEKLVIFPSVQPKKNLNDSFKAADAAFNVFDTLNENQMTDAEKMSKENRKDHPRVSSYCLGNGFNLDEISR